MDRRSGSGTTRGRRCGPVIGGNSRLHDLIRRSKLARSRRRNKKRSNIRNASSNTLVGVAWGIRPSASSSRDIEIFDQAARVQSTLERRSKVRRGGGSKTK